MRGLLGLQFEEEEDACYSGICGQNAIPPSYDCVCVEVLGDPSELVLGSGVVSSHDGLLMVLYRTTP